jgi:hypothetical protein
VTDFQLKRLSFLPERDDSDNGHVIAGQEYDNIYFIGGEISNVTFVSPIGVVTSVSGTANRITVANGTTTPVIDIAATYVGQTSITTLGTIGTGTWQGSVVAPQYGGTGVANASTITVGGNFSMSGAFTFAGTLTANTAITYPTTGTLATLAGSESLTNKSVNGVTLTTGGSASDFLNAQGNYVAGGTVQSVTGTANRITSTGGANPVLDIGTDVVTLTGSQTLTNKVLTSPTITVRDNVFTLQDQGDNTKQAQFELSGIATGNTRSYTVPDASTTLVGTDVSQTLTNKTLSTGTVYTAGVPIQVAVAQKTDTFSTTSTSFTGITGLSQSITPSATSNTVLVRAVINFGNSTSSMTTAFRLTRGGTAIGVGTSTGNRIPAGAWEEGVSATQAATRQVVLEWLDSPSTTSSTTYAVETLVTAGTMYVNRSATDTDSSSFYRMASQLTLQEIKG